MGQLAKDWTQLKTIIHQKDDALDRQAAQIADLQKQLAVHQQAALDADDSKAVAELRQTVAASTAAINEPALKSATGANATTPATSGAKSAPAHLTAPVTTFTK